MACTSSQKGTSPVCRRQTEGEGLQLRVAGIRLLDAPASLAKITPRRRLVLTTAARNRGIARLHARKSCVHSGESASVSRRRSTCARVMTMRRRPLVPARTTAAPAPTTPPRARHKATGRIYQGSRKGHAGLHLRTAAPAHLQNKCKGLSVRDRARRGVEFNEDEVNMKTGFSIVRTDVGALLNLLGTLQRQGHNDDGWT